MPLSRLQAEADRRLAQMLAAPHAADQAFMQAWVEDPGALPLTGIQAVLQEMDATPSGALDVLERLRDLTRRLAAASSDTAPPPTTAAMVLMLLLVAAERYIALKCPAGSGGADGGVTLNIDRPSVAAIVGACLLDRGLYLVPDSHEGGLRALNVLSDLPATAYGFRNAKQVIAAELAAALDSLPGGMTLDLRRRRLEKMQRDGVRDPDAIRAGLRRFEQQHGARLVFGVSAEDAPAPLRDPAVRAEMNADYGVETFFFTSGRRSQPSDDDAHWRQFSATLMTYIDDVVDALHRAPSPTPPVDRGAPAMTRSRVFISYSHNDRDAPWRERVVEHLGVLAHQGLIDLWDDTQIGAGQAWYDEIHAAMGTARVAVLLISPSFLTSKFILQDEVPTLFSRHEAAGMALMPVLVRDCAWKTVPWLARLQIRPGSKAVASSPEHEVDTLLAKIAEEVGQLCSGHR